MFGKRHLLLILLGVGLAFMRVFRGRGQLEANILYLVLAWLLLEWFLAPAKKTPKVKLPTKGSELIVEIPLCLKCLRPIIHERYYCPKCGADTHYLTPYLPFVSIPFYNGFYVALWQRLWGTERLGLFTWIGYSLIIVVYATPLLFVLPFAIRRKYRRWKVWHDKEVAKELLAADGNG